MAEVLIVGSVALDSIKTPYGNHKDILGGSCSYASMAATLFTDVNMVGVVGTDFPKGAVELFQSRNINLEGLEFAQGETFRWSGYYEYDMNQAHTLSTHLNVFGEFSPKIPQSYKESKYVFLANIHPGLQLDVLDQIENPGFVICDTMNLWITSTPKELKEVISKVDLMLLNEGEARQLCETPHLLKAARKVLEMGPRYVIIKKGEHGAIMMDKNGDCFISPAYPLASLKDPTGAGDTFAGGMIGYLAQQDNINSQTLRKSIIIGSTMASFTVEDFSLNKLKTVTLDDVAKRYSEFEEITRFNSFNPVYSGVI